MPEGHMLKRRISKMKKLIREEKLKEIAETLNSLEDINEKEEGWERDIDFYNRIYILIWCGEPKLTHEFIKWWMSGRGETSIINFIYILSNPN